MIPVYTIIILEAISRHPRYKWPICILHPRWTVTGTGWRYHTNCRRGLSLTLSGIKLHIKIVNLKPMTMTTILLPVKGAPETMKIFSQDFNSRAIVIQCSRKELHDF